MSKLSNVLKMLQMLETGRKYTLDELSEELEVSKRMIRQYKQELEMAGIYISSIKGIYGGYFLKNNTILPSIRVNNDDVELLKSKNDASLTYLIEKLELLANEYDINKADTTSEKFTLFQRAIKHKKKIEITYKSSNSQVEKRVIHPLEMFLFSCGWYVVAYCELRQSIRNFILDEILDYKILEESF